VSSLGIKVKVCGTPLWTSASLKREIPSGIERRGRESDTLLGSETASGRERERERKRPLKKVLRWARRSKNDTTTT
jgi:hypothetical protein